MWSRRFCPAADPILTRGCEKASFCPAPYPLFVPWGRIIVVNIWALVKNIT
jgi:hypothetical protein